MLEPKAGHRTGSSVAIERCDLNVEVRNILLDHLRKGSCSGNTDPILKESGREVD